MSDLELRCRFCGKRAGVACTQADGKARGTSHQIRRDDAQRWNNWKRADGFVVGSQEIGKPLESDPSPEHSDT